MLCEYLFEVDIFKKSYCIFGVKKQCTAVVFPMLNCDLLKYSSHVLSMGTVPKHINFYYWLLNFRIKKCRKSNRIWAPHKWLYLVKGNLAEKILLISCTFCVMLQFSSSNCSFIKQFLNFRNLWRVFWALKKFKLFFF